MSNKYVRLLAAAAVLCLGHNGWGQNPKLECLQGEVHIDSPPGVAQFRGPHRFEN